MRSAASATAAVSALGLFQVGQLDVAEVANADGTLTRRFVRVGAEVGGMTEIRSGLAAGDRVALPTEVGR